MKNTTKKKKPVRKDRSLTATGIVIAVIIALLLSAYLTITSTLQSRSLSRLEEGVETVINEITSKLERDSRILNATANIISQANNFDVDATLASQTPRTTRKSLSQKRHR